MQLVGAEHVGQRVIQRAQIRVDLVVERAGEETEVLPRLDRRARQDDAANTPVLERAHRLGHGEVGLARAGRADREGDGVGVHGVDVGDLPRRLGTHGLPGRESDDAGYARLARIP